MSERITFTRDKHGTLQMDADTLTAFFNEHRPGRGAGVATRVPRELRDAATAIFQRKIAEFMGTSGCTHDRAASLAIQAERAAFFCSQCDLAADAADADVVIA